MCNCGKKRNPPIPVTPLRKPIAQLSGRSPVPLGVMNRSAPIPRVVHTPTVRPRPVVPKTFVIPVISKSQLSARGRITSNTQFRITESTKSYDTSLWGPSLWFILHTLAEFGGVPQQWTDLIRALQISIPCSECSAHFQQWVSNHPFHAQTSPRQWILDLHNDVNQRLASPSEDGNLGTDRKQWTLEDVATTYGGDKQKRLREVESRITVFAKYTTSGIIQYLRYFVRQLH